MLANCCLVDTESSCFYGYWNICCGVTNLDIVFMITIYIILPCRIGVYRLEEAELEGTVEGDVDRSQALERCRDVYERAIANVPPLAEKRYWRRYIYLWIGKICVSCGRIWKLIRFCADFGMILHVLCPVGYALLEELQGPPSVVDGDVPEGYVSGLDRARDVYRECLRIIPHKKFTFGKVWLQAAHLEVRAKDLGAARKLLGRAIGKSLCHRMALSIPVILPLYDHECLFVLLLSVLLLTLLPLMHAHFSARYVWKGKHIQGLHRAGAAARRGRAMSSNIRYTYLHILETCSK